jgi:predicted glycosyltransferase
MDSQPRRIVLYSHDGMGIGHIRRNLLIAAALAKRWPDAAILLIAGVCEAVAFELPPNVDCLTVPALCKDSDGRYQSRRLPFSRKQIIGLRSSSIRGAVQAFDPDVLIVDKLPRGVGKELDRTLKMLKRGGRTRCVLGLRDILDDPQRVQSDWLSEGNEKAIIDYYDAVWVYGDANVYDAAREYNWPDHIASKIRYTGYLERATAALNVAAEGDDEVRSALGIAEEAQVTLCLVGGGEDGGPLAEAFAAAPLPADTVGVILSGPFMPAERRARLHAAAEKNPQLRVLDFVADPAPLMRLARRAVAMGGYNSVNELLCAGVPSLIVPRVYPRHEQLIRAQRLSELGVIEMLHPDDLSPQVIGRWLVSAPKANPNRVSLDFNGLSRIPGLLEELLQRADQLAVPGGVA